ncbi:MAG: amino acid adenylation domain-containing protein [Chloroflexota bacterium]
MTRPSFDRSNATQSLVYVLRWYVDQHPHKELYTFLHEGETHESTLTYAELDQAARAVATKLQEVCTPGQRALLLYPPSLDYITAFFGCLYAGVIAVPIYPPNPARLERTLPRLQTIVHDAQPTFVLTTSAILGLAEALATQDVAFQALQWIATDQCDPLQGEQWQEPELSAESIAFLQYTSGSTADPKGVMLSHGNLLANLAVIYQGFGHSADSQGVIWLPPYHDMGLIGGILQPLYGGFPVTLMSPVTFLQRPFVWLDTISQTRATTSGGPNFAFDLCVRKIPPEMRETLDLSSWSVAFNGAEPIRADTLERFVEAFSPCGFRPEAFYPCYGLAETTLMVTGSSIPTPPRLQYVQRTALQHQRVVAQSATESDTQTLVGSGQPFDDHHLVIANPEHHYQCGPDEVGEIWVAGPSVAQGYWARSKETHTTFHSYLKDTGAGPFLRTGDLGFLRHGELYVTGRIKDLIIIRGRNYYPQDIELTVEQSYPGLRLGCGAAFTVETHGIDQLVVVHEVDRHYRNIDVDGVVQTIRQAVIEQHEIHVHAVVLIRHGTILKTSSGKIQRHACRSAFLTNQLTVIGQHVAEEPTTAQLSDRLTRETLLRANSAEHQGLMESYLQQLLAHVLAVPIEKLDQQRTISTLGLDSLMAVEVQHTIEQDFNLLIPMVDVIQGPSIPQFAATLLTHISATVNAQATPLHPASEERLEYRLSHGQQALWFLHQLVPQAATYNLAYALRITSTVDVRSMRRAFEQIVERHPTLRTTVTDVHGYPTQQVHPQQDLWFREEYLPTTDETILHQRLAEEANRPFDLTCDALLRIYLFSQSDQEHVLLLVAHHIVVDFWSLAILTREFGTFYAAELQQEAAVLPVLPVQYADYVRWETDMLASTEGDTAWHYWRQQLAGSLPALNLPTDRPHPPVQTYRGAIQQCVVSKDATARIHALSETYYSTLYMTLLTMFSTLLFRYTNQTDLLIGSPTTGRNRAALTSLIGYFVNPVVLRMDLSNSPTFTSLLASTRQTVLDAFAHQQYPFPLLVERLQPDRDPSRSPIFQVMFTLQQVPPSSDQALNMVALNEPHIQMQLGQLSTETITWSHQTAPFDLTIAVGEQSGVLVTSLQYNSDLFDPATMQRMAGHFQQLINGILDQPTDHIAYLPWLTDAEREQLLFTWNATEQFHSNDALFHDQVALQAQRTPDAIAIVYEHTHISYQALDQRANQLAWYLQTYNVGPDTLVGICLERSVEMLIGLLGVLKTGGAFVPLDPALPQERLAYMLADAPMMVLIAQSHLRSSLPPTDAPIILLDSDWEALIQKHTSLPISVEIHPDNLAYIIYTSGSTGHPKGVQIAHAALHNFLWTMAEQPSVTAHDYFFAVTTLSFDIAALELFLPLLVGGRVVLVHRTILTDGLQLAAWMAKTGATVMQATPATWQLLLESGWEGLPNLKILCGGEAFPRSLANQLLAHTPAVWNMYGPTETTIWSATTQVPATKSFVPIGKPVANTQFYVLDTYGQPVAIGIPGELYIGGTGLARGYWQRAQLAAERFIPHPFTQQPGARLYRTGDVVRYLPNGQIEFLGRIDHQVKVRGFRIELGEIETILRQHPAVQHVVVMAQQAGRIAGDTILVAYIIGASPTPLAHTLRNFLKKHLPDYMIPAHFVLLDTFPMTPNGKVDRNALPTPTPIETPPNTAHIAPQSQLEQTIASIWQSVLNIETVGVNDNFFDLGGHSLLMTRVHSHLRDTLDHQITMVELFQYPTIRTLVQHLTAEHGDHALSQSGYDRAYTRRAATTQPDRDIAIVGMVGRFPGANDLATFWQNLCGGVESITFFSDEELLADGVSPQMLNHEQYVRATGFLADSDQFDAAFFGFNPREATLMDPQHRLFLECAWSALEDAGYDPDRYTGHIGVFAGVGLNTYLLTADRGIVEAADRYQVYIGNDKDFVPTRVSYKLNLRGPSLTVQTACSSSLVALHLACQSILDGESDMALAGGVSISAPQKQGYLYTPGGILSPDGHCRAFDSQAQGTVFGSGVGIVVLKRLTDAMADGDTIHGVVKGSAINNDGALKVGYTAPSVDGQANVITEALAVAQIGSETITYVEAHGTGTELGDPVEMTALTQAFTGPDHRDNPCAIGSVKTNIGHLDTAAGMAGLMKTVLSLKHRQLPPSLHFNQPNPQIQFAQSPFAVNTQLRDWDVHTIPRRAGVSSFGIGGTNAHVVLEEAPARQTSDTARSWHLLPLSAKTSTALTAATTQLTAYLHNQPDLPLADVAYTLQMGRHAFDHRRFVVCHDYTDARTTLTDDESPRVFTAVHDSKEPSIVFLCSGQGAQYVQMAAGLYQEDTLFRHEMNRCADILITHLDQDIRSILYPDPDRMDDEAHQLNQTALAQPALFAIEYAMTQLWISWGIRPNSLIGHSIGEYVAACLSGVLSLEDALTLVAARGRLMQALSPGAMLTVSLSESEVFAMLPSDVALAAVNAPALCVVSGPVDAIHSFESHLQSRDIPCRRLHTSHAFHSSMMDPILDTFHDLIARMSLHPPEIPYLSNVTGTWITAEQATDPMYWVRHLRETVRFTDGIQQLIHNPDNVFIEVGPGNTLGTIARQHTVDHAIVSSLRHPQDQQQDMAYFLEAVGKLWLVGAPIHWAQSYAHEHRQRVSLPTYPFERQRYWLDATAPSHITKQDVAKNALSEWFYTPLWKQTLSPSINLSQRLAEQSSRWLVFVDDVGPGSYIVEQLKHAQQDVIVVVGGSQFQHNENGVYELNPQVRDDYDSLIKELQETDTQPDIIIHLWNVTPSTAVFPTPDTTVEMHLNLGFHSLLLLTQALERYQGERPLQLEVISTAMQRIAGDQMTTPEKSTALGLCQVIPQEYPHITCRSIDVSLPDEYVPGQVVAEQILGEVLAVADDMVVAYRGEQRWIPTFEATKLNRPTEIIDQLRYQGVYLITGGLGGIGLTLASYLAETVQARLVLVSRTGLPERSIWPDLLATHHNGTEHAAITAIRMMEAAGAEVQVFQADVTDRASVETVVEQTLTHFGALHGIIHAAGLPGESMIQAKTPQIASQVLAPKVYGTRNLYAATQAHSLDFIVLCSSITAITGGFGQADYCAANVFLDSFAHTYTSRKGPRIVSINWDRWSEVGMAVHTGAPAEWGAIQSNTQRTVVDHPLLDFRLAYTPDQCIYLSEFRVESHWVLSEHLIAGQATVPGTTYLEMARAGYALLHHETNVELRDIVFVAPLVVQPDMTKYVLTILERQAEHYTFRIISKPKTSNGAATTWQEHARGSIRTGKTTDPQSHVLSKLIAHHHSVDPRVASHSPFEQEQAFLTVGPRWDTLQHVYVGTGEGVAALALADAFAEDVTSYTLHPAMLDVAVGAVKYLGEGDYLPLAYEKIQIRGSMPAKMYSYIRHRSGTNHVDVTQRDVITCDITLMDEDGVEIAEISGFSMRKMTDEAIKALQTYRDDQGAPTAAVPPNHALMYDQLLATPEQAISMTPQEGTQVFASVLSHLSLPQVIVSTVDLKTAIEQTRQLTKSHILDQLAAVPVAKPSHARPKIATPYQAPDSEVEQKIVDIWRHLLGIDQVGVQDNFFELGGTSLTGIQIIAELKQAFGVEIPAVIIFEAPTVRSLATYLNNQQNGGPSFEHSRDRAQKKMAGMQGLRKKRR